MAVAHKAKMIEYSDISGGIIIQGRIAQKKHFFIASVTLSPRPSNVGQIFNRGCENTLGSFSSLFCGLDVTYFGDIPKKRETLTHCWFNGSTSLTLGECLVFPGYIAG